MNEERFEDYYQILGISRSATVEDIKKARRELSKKYHPDLQSDEKLKEEYGAKLARINNAADVLLNPTTRAEYDREYDAYLRRQQARGQSSSSQSERRDDSYRTYWEQYEQQSQQSQQRTRTDQRRAESNENRRRTTAGQHAKSSKKSSFFSDIKQAYQEVRVDEKAGRKQERRAHKNVNAYVDEKFKDRETIPEEILYKFSKGTLHVFVSTVQELMKLKYITKDSIPKFVIRTRRGTAVVLTLFVLITGIASLGNDEPVVLPGSDITTSETGKTNDEDSSNLGMVFEEEQQQEQITIRKYHTIKYGETLSEIADHYGIRMSKIQKENNIKSPNLIQQGQTLTITYTYNLDDFDYFTNAITVEEGKSVKDIAEEYGTDVATIIALNQDAIVMYEGSYFIISSEINVPNFATEGQILQAKSYGQSYQKQQ